MLARRPWRVNVCDRPHTRDLTGAAIGSQIERCLASGRRLHVAPTRRDVLLLGAVAAAGLIPAGSAAASNGVSQAIDEFTGGALRLEGGVLLDVPEIADNGGAVPVRVVAEGARRIALFNDGNPNPGVAVFTFGRLVRPEATIRIRLAGSQNVYAVAEMADGTFLQAFQKVAVTVGGCG